MSARRPDSPPAAVPDQPETTDELAKDILKDQPSRRAAGERLSSRIAGRRYERAPIVSCSGRLFERCDLADPWEPDSTDRPLALGPVGMRFEERRQPAPHAKVKEPPKKPERPAWTPPKGVSAAPAKPKSEPTPAPVRPPPPAAVAEAPKADPEPPRGLPPLPQKTHSSTSGRFRMRPSSPSTAPKVRRIQRVHEAVEGEPPRPEPEAPPQRSGPPKPQSLDDLFGNLGGRDKRVGRKKDQE